ncbi:sugar phosphate exchanger 3-like [Actinia tenebrosa]|uniref:Sugar phosphate exchanger 3 n=1 Tax=Actinia tenebrosa TaxID=6105 RepID=A0A6P8HZ59_ACTTE|nr:sugar phosphate exchanger 3-like [Actinia tenebrosa]
MASQKWTGYHLLVFILTFMSYAFFHATRKAFSNVKDTLQKEWTPHNNTYDLKPFTKWNSVHFFKNKDSAALFLGAMDTTFLSTYALGLYISGALGDRFNLRKVLSLGMCLSAIMVFMFGTASKWLGIYNIWYYGVFMALNGFFQSAGWPSSVAIMGNWFGKSSRGFVFGLWSACASVGNIIGAFEAASVLNYGYEYAMMLPSVILFAGGIIVFFCLVPSPADIGLPMPCEDDSTEEERQPVFSDTEGDNQQQPYPNRAPYSLPDTLFQSSSVTPKENKKAIGFCQALLLPGVIPYSLSYACLKLVNYSFFFWLPYYLSNAFHWKDTVADELSTFYDIGGIIGGAIAGFITDSMRSRAPVVVTMLILSIGCLFGYKSTGSNYKLNVGVMTLTGFMIGGPANLISSAISADLGRQPSLRGNSEALATVTGIVDGTGSVGAAIGQILIPIINNYNKGAWADVFYFLMIMTFMSFVCIIIPPTIEFFRRLCFPPRYVYDESAASSLIHSEDERINASPTDSFKA